MMMMKKKMMMMMMMVMMVLMMVLIMIVMMMMMMMIPEARMQRNSSWFLKTSLHQNCPAQIYQNCSNLFKLLNRRKRPAHAGEVAN